MSLGKQMIEQLRLLSAAESVLAALPSGSERFKLLTALDEPAQATLEFFDHDRYSAAVRALDVSCGGPVAGDVRAYLSARAAEIARRLSFLEEPLAVWELDGGEHIAQLRSSPPQREGDEVAYWEVTLCAGERPGAHMTRYRWTPDMVEREIVAYPATFALIGRMVDSLAAALKADEA